MYIATMILGWLGVLMFLVLIFSYQKMAQRNEYAFLHLLMALMYATWFPLPLALQQLLNSDVLLIGTMFGVIYLVMLVISMMFQTGHIAFIVKHNEDDSISDSLGNYMMATLTNPFESLVGVFKSIWAIFLGIAFWQSNEIFMAGLMALFGLFIFYYLFIALDRSLVKRLKLFSKVKPNPFVVNIETLMFFITLMGYMTFV